MTGFRGGAGRFYSSRAVRFAIAVCAAFFLSAPPCRAASPETVPAPAILATLPWLAGIARFIVGTTIKVQSASAWNSSGVLRIPRGLPQNSAVIALDPKDADRFGLVAGQKGLHVLYENLPIEESQRASLPFNPSVLPFLSQRLLIVLCELSPDNYSFYQRRLAEFQSRLESTVEVGRSLIHDIRLLDLSGSISPWVRSASENTARPPDELWNAWSGNTRTQELSMAVKEAENRGWWILLDAWTPAPIRARVSSPKSVLIAPPETDYEFFTYLHDIYLQIWTAASSN